MYLKILWQNLDEKTQQTLAKLKSHCSTRDQMVKFPNIFTL